jgi:protein-S-isoprenylcysteine O-methyltransferase Ste14
MVKLPMNRLRRWCIVCAVLGGGLLTISGAWDDPWLWGYIAIWMSVFLYAILGLDDDLAQERFKPPTRGADRVALAFVQLVAIAHLVVGALDLGRWHIAPVSPAVRVISMAGMVVMAVLVFYSMHSNRFFSSVVRIQAERGHRVVDVGPYARVRHPGYAGMIPLMAFSGLALGSWLAFALGVVYGGLIFRRVLFEDKFLQANLTGYREYVQRVRYRLVPGLW